MSGELFPGTEEWEPTSFVEELKAGDYTSEGVPGISEYGAMVAKVRPEGPAQEVLCRLFLAGERVTRKSLEGVLARSYEGLKGLGILAGDGVWVQSLFRLRPHKEGYYFEDFPRAMAEGDAEVSAEFVMGVAPTTRILRQITPTFARSRVLDLCCGGGWLALGEAGDGVSVVGSDLSGRCLAVAKLNARLNGKSGVDWRQGPWFEPVRGEEFDLIISNPPFVQSPGGRTMAMDTPVEEDPVSVILSQMPSYLAPNGVGCLLLNWQYQDEDDWGAHPLSCLPETGVQVLLFELQRHDPRGYATHWVRQNARFEDPKAREAEIGRWVEYLEGRGSAGVSSGFLLMRRCEPGEEWAMTESRELKHFAPSTGDEFRRVFENQSWLGKLANELDILEARFRAVDGVQKEVVSGLKNGEWVAESIRLTSPARVMYDGHVDEALLMILEEAGKGNLPRGFLPEVARIAGVEEVNAIEAGVAGLLSELVGRGLLEPVA
ncbi:methyltransferase [Verrucomicrobiaceae bacterium 227]